MQPGVPRRPDDWPKVAPPFTTADDGAVIRSKVVRGHPYRIVYTAEPDLILILAYVHERREPGYRLHRWNHSAGTQKRRRLIQACRGAPLGSNRAHAYEHR